MRIAALLALATGLGTVMPSRAKAQPRQRDLPAAMRTMAGVTLNRDAAASIRRALGPTAERKVGEGDEAFLSWCYVAGRDTGVVLLELMSDAGDLGTQERTLNVIRLRRSSSPDDRRGCAPLRTSAKLTTPGGVRLGMDRGTARRLLGPPTRSAGDSVVYDFETREYMPRNSRAYRVWNTPARRKTCFEGGAPYANVAARVTLLFTDDRVTEIRLERYDQSVC